MKVFRSLTSTLVALSPLGIVALAEDVLHSHRLAKRGVDAEGNYNLCKIDSLPHLYLQHGLT